MKIFLTLVFLALIASCAHAELVEDAPKRCTYCAEWNTPQTPYQVFGNTWYVGTAGLASILVVTDAGLILIDGALAQSAHLIEEKGSEPFSSNGSEPFSSGSSYKN